MGNYNHVPQLKCLETMDLSLIHIYGEYLSLLFNSNFYCIFGHDSEVSCNGFLFNGSSNVLKLKLSSEQVAALRDISGIFMNECNVQDDLQEEMLRIILKRFIITCTRIARGKFFVDSRCV